ncbi:MAG: hypothetical protein ACM3NQ_04415 [Bacteroidales bacterium]
MPAPTPAAVATRPAIDYARTPFLVIWEVTRACALACVHCRASAIARRDPGELAKIIDASIDLGLPLQINTTISRRTLPTLDRTAARVSQFPLALWAVFFLVQTGRGTSLDQIDAGECEHVLRWLRVLSRTVPFGIKTTEAPHCRRVLAEGAATCVTQAS